MKCIDIHIEVLPTEFKTNGIPDKTREFLKKSITSILRGAFISVDEMSIQISELK